MKRYIKSSIYVDSGYWKELRDKIKSVTCEYMREHDSIDNPSPVVTITLDYVPDSFTNVACLKADIYCSEVTYSKELVHYLNSIFVDTDGNNTYFYEDYLFSPDSFVIRAEFPVGTKFNI